MRVLIFDLKGDYGHFRTYYSTSSPVSFSIIPPTALLGVIGAILGLPKENNEYLEILNRAKTKVAIRLNKPIKKVRMGLNLINTKGNVWVPKKRKEGPRTPIKFEFLKDPSYRVFVSMEDEQLFNDLVKMISNHHTHYSISLGLSELLADVRFVGVKDFIFQRNSKGYVTIETVVPLKHIMENGVALKEGMQFLKERMPFNMDSQRVVLEYGEILLEVQGKKMDLIIDEYYKAVDENLNIIFIQ